MKKWEKEINKKHRTITWVKVGMVLFMMALIARILRALLKP